MKKNVDFNEKEGGFFGRKKISFDLIELFASIPWLNPF